MYPSLPLRRLRCSPGSPLLMMPFSIAPNSPDCFGQTPERWLRATHGVCALDGHSISMLASLQRVALRTRVCVKQSCTCACRLAIRCEDDPK